MNAINENAKRVFSIAIAVGTLFYLSNFLRPYFAGNDPVLSVLGFSPNFGLALAIQSYNDQQLPADKAICNQLAAIINRHLAKAESKIWHGHPVWFLDGNPIVGYSKQKRGIRLMFWSGADFGEEGLDVLGQKFKDASIFFNDVSEINARDMKRWLGKAEKIQWDYKNIVKRKGKLVRVSR